MIAAGAVARYRRALVLAVVIATAAAALASVPPAVAAPNVTTMATTTATVSPVRAPGAFALTDLPAAYITFSGPVASSFAPNSSASLRILSAPSGTAELHVFDRTGATDDSQATLASSAIPVMVNRSIASSGDDSFIRIKASTAGSYAGQLFNGSDTVTFSFSTVGAPATMALSPTSQQAAVGSATSVTVELRDANGNRTQPLVVDSVAISQSGGATLSTTSLTGSDLAKGIAPVGVTLTSSGTTTVTATPAGTLVAGGVTAGTVTVESLPDTTLNATGLARWGGDDSVPVDALPGAPLAGVTVTRIDVGTGSACALGGNGKVYCWGYGGYGQLGSGISGSSQTPLAVSTSGVLAGRTIADVSVGDNFACAVDTGGRGYCWGYSDRLGAGAYVSDPTVPNALEPFSAVAGKRLIAVTAGGSHACALDDSGQGYCWGSNSSGQLGDGTSTSRVVPVAISAPPDGSLWASLSAGAGHTCGISRAGALYCWGYNAYGQLGDGTWASRPGPASVGAAPDASSWQSVSAGDYHTCAKTMAHSLYCWGNNNEVQLGLGSLGNRNTPGLVPASSDSSPWQSVAAGRFHTCARSAAGQTSCWGQGVQGQLGLGPREYTASPLAISPPAGSTWSQVSTGIWNSCGVSASGVAYCWGAVANGALGSSSQSTNALTPIPVDTANPLSGALLDDVAAGPNHRCVLVDGAAYCWGRGSSGELGNGVAFDSATPVAVQRSGALSGKSLVAIEAGFAHTCAIDSLGDVYCWGSGGDGELGNGSTSGSTTPVAVTKASGALLGEDVVQLALAGGTSCALTQSARVLCWGYGGGGQIGDGSTSSRQVPVPINASWLGSGDAITSVSAGSSTAGLSSAVYSAALCLTTQQGSVRCWGRTYLSELNGGGGSSPLGVPTTGLPAGVRLVSVLPVIEPGGSWYGATTMCAMSSAGEIYCIGSNESGQLGNGTTLTSSAWVRVNGGDLGGRPATSIAAAGTSVCVTDAVGRPYCWGNNSAGQLGDGTRVNRSTPVRVNYAGPLAGRPVVQLAGNGRTFWALTDDGPLLAEAPAQPSVTPGNASVTVTWVAPFDTGGQAVTGYRLRYSSDGGSAWTVVTPDLASSDRSATISSLTNGRGYVVQVAVVTSAGLGAWSGSSAISTPRTIPGAPSGLQASSGDGRVDLTWASPDDTGGAAISGYTVTVTPSAGTVTVLGTTAAVTGLANGTSYSFRVAASNVAGAGSNSSPVSATPEPGPGTPSSVVATPGNTQVDLTWNAPTAVPGVTITGYALQRSSDGGSTWSTVASDTGSTTRSHTVSSLTNGTTYRFRVAARSGSRQGLWSSLSNSATPRTVPSSPSSVTATPGDRRLSVSWSQPGDGGALIEGYRIEYSTDNGSNWTTAVANTGNSARSYVITGLTNGTPYRVRVAAINVAGTGPFTSTESTTAPVPDSPISYVEDATLPAPSQVCAYSAHREVTLSWNAASGAQGYVVEYRAQGGSWNQLRVSSVLELTVDGLTNGTRYEFRVAATRTDGRRTSWGSGCLMTWGSNEDRALSNLRRWNGVRTTPMTVRSTPSSAVTSITTGWASACLLTSTRDPYCWGSSRYNQLGSWPYVWRPYSAPRGLTPSSTLSGTLGTHSACSITTSRDLRCIGLNSSGQLGVGDTANRSTLTPVGGVLANSSVTQVSLGEGHGCAVTTAGRVACWGLNVDGQVDISLGSIVLTPVWVDGVLSGQTVAEVAVGQTHSCARTTTGRVACWGGDYAGQLGNGSTYVPRSGPAWITGVINSAIVPGTTVIQVEAGANHTCVLTSAGRAACWGSNSQGQLGIGNRSDKNSPVWVDSALPTSGLDVISAGGASTCASGDALDTYCWGLGVKGQLGNADRQSRARPQKVLGLLAGSNANQIEVGGVFALAMWGGWATPGQVASAPREVRVSVVGTMANLTWAAPRVTGGAEIAGYRIQQRASDAEAWTTVSTVQVTSAPVPLASDGYTQLRVVALTSAGEGVPSAVVEALRNTSARSVRENVPITVTTSWGAPLSGARVTWASRDGVFTSVVPVTTTSLGTVTIPQLVTGPVTFTLDGGSVTARGIQLGTAALQKSVPASGGVSLTPPGDFERVTRSVTIRMPDGTAVPGALMAISGGLTGQRVATARSGDRSDQARWVAPGYSANTTTNAFGQATVSGFRKRSSTSDVYAEYSNGYLRQARNFRLGKMSTVQFEQMPLTSIVSVSSTSIAQGGSAVVTVRAVDENSAPVAGRTVSLQTVISVGGASVRVSPRNACAIQPSAVTDGAGIARVTVCPGSTAQWRAIADSMVPSTPVTITVTPAAPPPPAPGPAPGPGPGPGPGPAPAPSPSPSASASPSPSPSPSASASPSPSPSPSSNAPTPVPVQSTPPPGEGQGLVGGKPDPNFAMEAEPGSQQVAIEGTGFQISLQSGSGAVDQRGALVIAPGGELALAGGGFAARDSVSAYIDPPTSVNSSWTRLVSRVLGTTVYLGEVVADDQGALAGQLDVPESIAPGDRMLQLVGTTATGDALVLTLGIAVAERANPTITITGSRGKGKDRAKIILRGQSTGLASTTVRPWTKSGAQRSFVQDSSRVKLPASGQFTWSKKSAPRTSVYFTAPGGVRSNTVALGPASRAQ